MKYKNIFYSILSFVLILFVVSSVYSYKLEIERVVSKKIDVNNLAEIALEIKNNQDKDIRIEVEDNLVFNNNGLNIECYELVIPKNSTVILNYSDIYDYKFNIPGVYTLNSTKISYTYEDKDYEQYIDNDTIEVIGETQSISQIVNVYQCNNVKSINMQTVSSNSGNFRVNFNTGGINVNSYNQLEEMQEGNDVTIKSKLKNNLLKNQKILDVINNEIKEGYSFDRIEVNAINETTGVFDLIFIDITNRQKIISGTSENMLINIDKDETRQYNKIILPIFLGVFLVWVILSCIYLIIFKKDLKHDSVLELFKPKIKNEKLENKFVCKDDDNCNINQLINDINDLEEKSEIITFIKNNRNHIKNEDYKKYIYKKLNKEQIDELKEIVISSLEDANKKV